MLCKFVFKTGYFEYHDDKKELKRKYSPDLCRLAL
jgi:hypothetical protein